MSLNWQAPPTSAVRGGAKVTKWGTIAQELRDNPRKPEDPESGWALVATRSSRTATVTLANGISAGRRPEFEPAGAFESAWAEDAGKFPVWARYVGEAGPAPIDLLHSGDPADEEWDDDLPE